MISGRTLCRQKSANRFVLVDSLLAAISGPSLFDACVNTTGESGKDTAGKERRVSDISSESSIVSGSYIADRSKAPLPPCSCPGTSLSCFEIVD